MRFPSKGGADFAIAPAGNHVGICNAIIDLGIQPGRGQFPDPRHEVYVRFELPQERVTYTKDGQQIEGPMSIGRTFTASMSPKANLRKFVEGWFGKQFPSDEAAADFDFAKLLGRRCLINVTHTERAGKVYANITGASPLPKGMVSTEPQHNASLFYSLDAPDPAAYHALPEWLRKKVDGRIVEKQHDTDPGFASGDAREPANSGEPFNDEIPW